ncbi:hypothetical protein HN51_024868, partial [Arachis hypogaea]
RGRRRREKHVRHSSLGLLVPELIEVAHRVYVARNSLVSGLSQLARAIPGLRCELCNEVHIVYVG